MNRRFLVALFLVLLTWPWVGIEHPARSLWPSVVALSLVFLMRSVVVGLLTGAFAGVILLADGNPLQAFIDIFDAHLLPALQSRWNACILVFTLLMGGFVAVIEHGGGIQGLLERFLGRGAALKQRVQWSAFGLGCVCFFDGLANSMLVGRVMRPIADRAGISREKLAYIVDSTSAPIACVSFISTWIAYQLSMILEGLAQTDAPGNAYLLFLRSIPVNFYCLFTLALVAIVITRGFDYPFMRRMEAEAAGSADLTVAEPGAPTGSHWLRAGIPLGVLIVTMVGGLYASGAEKVWPVTVTSLAGAFGNADTALVLVCSSAFASIVALLINHRLPHSATRVSEIYLEGLTTLFLPALILISAWCLSSVLKSLGAAAALSQLLSGTLPPHLVPASVFAVGALISFTTGTSWGTMGVLMPLALPLAIALGAELEPAHAQTIQVATIAAVFSGAVFGDHSSPMSDTTIVSSISCGVEPTLHVRAQFPYALTAATVALITGFLPVGYGFPWWISLPIGIGVLAALPAVFRAASPRGSRDGRAGRSSTSRR